MSVNVLKYRKKILVCFFLLFGVVVSAASSPAFAAARGVTGECYPRLQQCFSDADSSLATRYFVCDEDYTQYSEAWFDCRDRAVDAFSSEVDACYAQFLACAGAVGIIVGGAVISQ